LRELFAPHGFISCLRHDKTFFKIFFAGAFDSLASACSLE